MRFWNKYTLIGLALIIVGTPLALIWIGFPLIMIGFFIADYGIVLYLVKKVPWLDAKSREILKAIKESYKSAFGGGIPEKPADTSEGDKKSLGNI